MLLDLARGNETQPVIAWPDGFLASLRDRIVALHGHRVLGAEEMSELKEYGLVKDMTGRTTALGEAVTRLVLGEECQSGDELPALLRSGADRLGGSVLEVGCGTGWAIRSLATSAAERIAIDIDATALALGCRYAQQERQDVRFYRCSAHALPFPDNRFDCIICRNALTYMHQARAVGEMARVLKKNGLLLIRFENWAYDLRRLWHADSLRAAGGRLRDLSWGLLHAAIGWQRAPESSGPRAGGRWPHWLGSPFRCGRAFATLFRLKRMLRRGRCEILRVEASRRCPRLLGCIPTQSSLLAKKTGAARVTSTPGWFASRPP